MRQKHKKFPLELKKWLQRQESLTISLDLFENYVKLKEEDNDFVFRKRLLVSPVQVWGLGLAKIKKRSFKILYMEACSLFSKKQNDLSKMANNLTKIIFWRMDDENS